MATGYIILPVPAPVKDVTVPPGMSLYSAGTTEIHYWQELFDPDADNWVYWTFQVPFNFASDPVLRLVYKMASATTNAVRWVAFIAAIDEGATAEGAILDAANALNDDVPGTAGLAAEAQITLTNNDSMDAGFLIVVALMREGSHVDDNATGDAELVAATFEYTLA